MCSQQELMYYVYSAFSNMGKKRSDIVSFLCLVFKAYFPAGEASVSKKMPGLDKAHPTFGVITLSDWISEIKEFVWYCILLIVNITHIQKL